MDNRLYRSRETKMLAGVCGGIADMFNFDPTLVRLVTVALILFSGSAFILVYLLCAIIIPLEPSPGYILRRHRHFEEPAPNAAEQTNSSQTPPEPSETKATETSSAENEAPAEKKEPSQPVSEGTETEQQSLSNDDTVITTESDRY